MAELHYTEWSSSCTPFDPIHDSYHSAAFILDKIRHVGNAATSMSYWTFTDIFEEAGPRATPFHGGFGMLNYQDIAKPSYFAFRFLNRLGDTELACADPDAFICRAAPQRPQAGRLSPGRDEGRLSRQRRAVGLARPRIAVPAHPRAGRGPEKGLVRRTGADREGRSRRSRRLFPPLRDEGERRLVRGAAAALSLLGARLRFNGLDCAFQTGQSLKTDGQSIDSSGETPIDVMGNHDVDAIRVVETEGLESAHWSIHCAVNQTRVGMRLVSLNAITIAFRSERRDLRPRRTITLRMESRLTGARRILIRLPPSPRGGGCPRP